MWVQDYLKLVKKHDKKLWYMECGNLFENRELKVSRCDPVQNQLLINSPCCGASWEKWLKNLKALQKQSRGGVLQKGALKSFTKSTGKHLCRSLLYKVSGQWSVFSWKFCKIFKNTFFYRKHPVVTSGILVLLSHSCL